jgi:ribonuclease J
MSAADTLEIIPLGGLGEFGLNCAVLRCGDDLLVVDAGLMFPTADFLGVETVVPDFSYLSERKGAVRAVLLTHGHEDHIGALPFLAPKIDCPVYGTRLTIGLARERLRRVKEAAGTRLVPVGDGEVIEAGPFTVEFIPVAHSIPDAACLAVRTPAGTILHTADFKLDETPVDGRTTDLGRIERLGREGIRVLLVDSTNAPTPGCTPSERCVGQALRPVFRDSPSRILLSCFSTHIHRLQQIFDLAAEQDRSVSLVGRSLIGAADTALSLGHLRIPPGIRMPPDRLMNLPPRRGVIVASGSQGEPLSAMTRIALGEHTDVAVGRGDVAILSARTIPGNEMPISRLIDHLYRRGAEVIAPGEGTPENLHVSGHACQEDLRRLLALARPDVVLPVHGSYRHLLQCARLAESSATPPPSVVIAETGDIVRVDRRGARTGGRAPVGRVHVDGELEEVDEIVLRDRRHLSADGIVLPVLLLDRASGTLASPPEIVARGFGPLEGREEFQRRVAGVVSSTVAASGAEAAGDRAVIKTKVITDLKRFLRSRTGRHPLILPVILEV